MCWYVHSKFYELFDGGLGLALPYNGTALAVSDQRREMIRQAAFRYGTSLHEAIDDAFGHGNGRLN